MYKWYCWLIWKHQCLHKVICWWYQNIPSNRLRYWSYNLAGQHKQDLSKTWQLKLPSNKCQHNRITLSTDASTGDDYSLSDVHLPTVNNVRDLGVLVDSRLTFRDHINSIVSRGQQCKFGGVFYARMSQTWFEHLQCTSDQWWSIVVHYGPSIYTTCKPARICPTAVY